ncbi:MAG: GNAT family N-acetyltransferase [Rhodanobacter sp.]
MSLDARSYSSADRASCLAIFDSNVPESFTVTERAEFAAFLDKLPGPYLVVVDESGRSVACGGYAVNPGTTCADLCWGMVVRDRQREGIGRFLTDVRLQRIKADSSVTEVLLRTSHDTSSFYERIGFVVEAVRQNGIAPGLHLCTMRLQLRPSENGLRMGGITER